MLNTKQLKITTPTPFTGERKKLDTFLLQMILYFKFNKKLFRGEVDKVMYASYYMQGDVEAWIWSYLKDWMQHFNNQEDADNKTRDIFKSFNKFRAKIHLVFRDINEQRTAEQDICCLRQTKSAADYTAQFKRISTTTDWDETA